jgi:hypothetical protein
MQKSIAIEMPFADMPRGFLDLAREWAEKGNFRRCMSGHPSNALTYGWYQANGTQAGQIFDVEITGTDLRFMFEPINISVAEFQRNYYLAPRAHYAINGIQQEMFAFFGFDVLHKSERLTRRGEVGVVLPFSSDDSRADDFTTFVNEGPGMLYLGVQEGEPDPDLICGQIVKSKTGNFITVPGHSDKISFYFKLTGGKSGHLYQELKHGWNISVFEGSHDGRVYYFVDHDDYATGPSVITY